MSDPLVVESGEVWSLTDNGVGFVCERLSLGLDRPIAKPGARVFIRQVIDDEANVWVGTRLGLLDTNLPLGEEWGLIEPRKKK